jgi:hypothetical protein
MKKTFNKPKSRVAIAKDFQRHISNLQRERGRLYTKALRALKVTDTAAAFVYFFNDQQGHCGFLETLK